MKTVCFSHGKESGPWGTKIKALAKVAEAEGWAVESLDYQGMDNPLDRVEKLVQWSKSAANPYVFVGSSMGGYVAAAAAHSSQPLGLFLMAPAFYVPGYEDFTPGAPKCPVIIVHGWHDEIIPWQNGARFGAQANARVVLVNSDHGLASALPELEEELVRFLGLVD
ncbi:MAG: alpha/beta hydrolase [Gammaproteobacteria bacterium]